VVERSQTEKMQESRVGTRCESERAKESERSCKRAGWARLSRQMQEAGSAHVDAREVSVALTALEMKL
jgi:hypothetical protein